MTDPLPRDRLMALVRRFPAYGRLAWRRRRDRRLSATRRLTLIAGAAYLASPIDLVPGIIPLAGQLDDAAVILLALRAALSGLTPDEQDAHLAAVSLRREDLDEDLETVRGSSAWLARGTVRLGWRVTRAGGRGLVRAAGSALRWAARRIRET